MFAELPLNGKITVKEANLAWDQLGEAVRTSGTEIAAHRGWIDEFHANIWPIVRLADCLELSPHTTFQRTAPSTPACDIILDTRPDPTNLELKVTGRITTKKSRYGIWRDEFLARVGKGGLIDSRSTDHIRCDIICALAVQFATLHEEHRKLIHAGWDSMPAAERLARNAKLWAQHEGRRSELLVFIWDLSADRITSGDFVELASRTIDLAPTQWFPKIHIVGPGSDQYVCIAR